MESASSISIANSFTKCYSGRTSTNEAEPFTGSILNSIQLKNSIQQVKSTVLELYGTRDI